MSSSIPSWQILTAHVQPFRGARDLAFCLKVPLDSLLVWASSEGSSETARMRRLAWTFAARIGDKYQIRLTRSNKSSQFRNVFRIGMSLMNRLNQIKSAVLNFGCCMYKRFFSDYLEITVSVVPYGRPKVSQYIDIALFVLRYNVVIFYFLVLSTLLIDWEKSFAQPGAWRHEGCHICHYWNNIFHCFNISWIWISVILWYTLSLELSL